MKKVLIISYFYPPSYFVGGKRVAAWAEHLHASGVYPIIITRKWNPNQSEITDKVIDNSYKHQKGNTHELYQLPYVYSLRDRLHQKNRWPLLRKALTFMEIFLSYFFISANKTHLSFYKKAIKILEQEPDIDTLLISGKPFQSFFIGYALKKKFPRLKWIPDYRDEWTSHPLHAKNTPFVLRILDAWAEKKWTSNASYFLATSHSSTSIISKYIEKPGIAILNGFNGEIKPYAPNTRSDEILLLYSGTIYSNQQFEAFMDASIALYKENIPIRIHWAGIDLDPMQGKRIRNYAKDWPELFVFHNFLDQDRLELLFQKCHFLLLCTYANAPQWLPVKLFEYFRQNKPIIVWNEDYGEMCRLVHETKTGLIFNEASEWKNFMQNYAKSGCEQDFFNPNLDEMRKYARIHQTKILADLIKG